MTALNIRNEHSEQHSRPTMLSDVILGGQDGLVNVLGIILGVSAATSDVRLIFVAALAALGAETISMAAVAYTSTKSRFKHYLKEVETEKREMREVPKVERQEVVDVLVEWGYKGKKLKSMTDLICSNEKAWLEFMMSFELKLAPVEKSAPAKSFVTVLIATALGSVIPLIPFIFFSGNIATAAIASVILSAIVLFIVGYYEAKVTLGSLWRSGMEMLLIGLTAGFAGYLIGRVFGAVPT